MNCSLENCISLQNKWNRLRKDIYSLESFSKEPVVLENHLKEVESYKAEVINSGLLPSHKEALLVQVENYKNAIPKTIQPTLSKNCFSELVYFFLFFSIGSIIILAANAYSINSREAKERGLKEGLNEKLNEILKKYGRLNERV